MITIDFHEPGPFAVGSQLRGLLTWTSEQAKQPRAIKAFLAWRTEGRGSEDGRIVSEAQLPIGVLTANTPVQVPFEFVLPAEGPVSYEGHLLRIIWELHVEIDEPWAFNEKISRIIVVVPRMVSRD